MTRTLGGKPQHPDERLRERVRAAIADYAAREAVDVAVTIRDGVAVLQGVVDSLDQRERLGRMAAAVPGVRGVENLLVIGMDAHAGDEGSQREIARRLARSPARRLGVEVRGGVAHILGEARDPAEVEAAREIAERTEGIRDVVVEVRRGDRAGPPVAGTPLGEPPVPAKPRDTAAAGDPRDAAAADEARRRPPGVRAARREE